MKLSSGNTNRFPIPAGAPPPARAIPPARLPGARLATALTALAGSAALVVAAPDSSNGTAAAAGAPSGPALVQLSETIDEIYREACLALVRVRSKAGLIESVANGFFVGDGSLVATVFPSEELPDEVTVLQGDRQFVAEVAAFDPRVRVALLEAEGMSGTVVELARSAELPQTAARLYALTESEDPLCRAIEGRLVGRVKMFQRNILPVSLLRLNLATTQGTVGAPVLDEDGKTVGTVIVDVPEDVGAVYVLPSPVVRKIAGDYAAHGAVRHGWIGITLEEGTTTPRVLECRPESPAAAAGLRPGDIILRIGSNPVQEYQDVVDAIYFLSPDVATEIEILRGLSRRSVQVTPAVRPESSPPPPVSAEPVRPRG